MTEILLKVKDDINCQWDTALAWALNAKNSSINVSGFSPHQLVFGKNVNLPSSMNDQLSPGYSTNPLIIEHLKALHSATESFMKAESSVKLRNALRKQTRHTREHFDLGQAVYYKRDNDIKWKGLSKRKGQDGLVVFIRHGGFYVKVHCPRVQISDSLLDTIPQDNNDSQLHSQALSQQADKLNKNTRHTSSDVYLDSDLGDEQYSINSKETSVDNIIKDNNLDNNSKTNSPSSHIEVPTSDLPRQYQTSSSSPSSSLLPPSSSPPSSLVSANPQNPDPISNLTNRLSNISLEDLSQNP